jgi:hypothetical protein
VVVSLAPVRTEQDRASCPNCSAPLALDQRYCLACGQPVSPVRLAFLDVLQTEADGYTAGRGALPAPPPGYATVIEPASGAYGWTRRYSGVFALFSVLLMASIIGLLVGHWITQNKALGPQVVKVEGLSATPLAAGAGPTATAAPPKSTAAPTLSKVSAKTEAKEATEARAIEKTPPAKPVKVSATKLQKLGNTTGKKHEEEINSLGAQPIETGGGG